LGEDISVLTVAIILQELQYRDPVEQSEQLDLVVATYISTIRTLSLQGRTRLDDHIGRASRGLTPESYGHVLNLVGETLAQATLLPQTLADVIHLGILMLKEHPNSEFASRVIKRRLVADDYTQIL
jgi:hypothetical protein